eukprot:2088314-Alexandrium_andersonii.AAC.1
MRPHLIVRHTSGDNELTHPRRAPATAIPIRPSPTLRRCSPNRQNGRELGKTQHTTRRDRRRRPLHTTTCE